MKIKKLHNPIFKVCLMLILGEKQEFEKYMKKHYEEFDTEGYDAVTCKRDGNIIVFVETGFKNYHAISSLQHELLHAAIFTMDYCGVPKSSDTEEVIAYLIGYYTKELLPFFVKNYT